MAIDAGDEEVDVAVVVEVGGGDAHGVADTGDTGARGDVRKRPPPSL